MVSEILAEGEEVVSAMVGLKRVQEGTMTSQDNANTARTENPRQSFLILPAPCMLKKIEPIEIPQGFPFWNPG
jgi:hypothetical protein